MRLIFTLCIKVLFFATLLCVSWQAAAQNFRMVKDINGSMDASPNNYYHNSVPEFTVLNGICYFKASESTYNNGLWRSDGTAAGTFKLLSADINDIVSTKNKVFFSTSKFSPGLWTSDGTVTGTKQVFTTAPAGFTEFYPNYLTDVNGSVFFVVQGHSYNDQLWKTDGTAAGTVLVKDFQNSGSGLSSLTAVGNKLYFTVQQYDQNNVSSTYLWISDGTTKHTYRITEEVANPEQITAVTLNNGQTVVYFTGTSPSQLYGTRYLWFTNGDQGNFALAANKDKISIYEGSNMINVNNVLYFTGWETESEQVYNLYKYDISTSTNIEPIKLLPTNIDSSGGYSAVYSLASDSSGQIYYSLYDASISKYQFWKTDGTSAGNVLLKENMYAYDITAVHSGVYFTGTDSTHGEELWKSNGSPEGTSLIKDINPGLYSSSGYYLTYNQKGTVFFAANDGQRGIELWKSDGTNAGTMLVKDINTTTTSSSYPSHLTAFKNQAIFNADDGRGGPQRLWKSNGTEAGTSIISQKLIPYDDLNMQNHYVFNNTMYLSGTVNGAYGLVKTDGTEAGTVLVKGLKNNNIVKITGSINLVYFVTQNYFTNQSELWRSDGTTAGTYLLKNDFTASNHWIYFASIGSTLIFFEMYDNNLWKTDGTVVGTALIKKFTSFNNTSTINPRLFSYKNIVYFEASENGDAFGLWRTDGTTAKTELVSSQISDVDNFTICGNYLYFSALADTNVFGNIGEELFKTDGTTAGIQLVKDVLRGSYSSQTGNYTNVNGTLYFFAVDSSFQMCLWKSDGTATGTRFIKTIGYNSYYLNNKVMANVNGSLYFLNTDYKMWHSDGTTNGTHPVEDNNLQDVQLYYGSYDDLDVLIAAGGQVFFQGFATNYGMELYAGSSSTVLPVMLLHFSGKLVSGNSVLQWSTASEHNSSHYVLERSINGRDFYPITTVAAAGNTNYTSKYSFTDSNISKLGIANVYYRLQQVDKDEKATMSSVVKLSISNTTLNISATPNPIENKLNLTVSSGTNLRAQLMVINAAGKEILHDESRAISASTGSISYNASSWSAGIYFVKFILSDGSTQVIKVLKK